jgi:NAD(P)H-hydrate epimerase
MRIIKASDIKIRKRKKDSHKGQNGEALIIGGSENYTGALALAGLAALRTGADWVTVAAPEKVAWAINCLTPDLITKKAKGGHFQERHLKEMLNLAGKHDAVLIGNGIGLKSVPFVRKFVQRANKPMVIDADGVKAINLGDARNAILTPHHKELEMLMKKSGIKSEKQLQKKLGDNVIVIKGKVDRIISRDRIACNKTGNEGMTVGGTGDVLSGLAVGFLCQGYSRFDSACYAAYINGKAGDMLKKKKGYSFIASDLVDALKGFKRKGRW